MARPKKEPRTSLSATFTIRLNPDVAERVEVIRSEFQKRAPFVDVTTSEVLRHLVTESSAATMKSLGIDPLVPSAASKNKETESK